MPDLDVTLVPTTILEILKCLVDNVEPAVVTATLTFLVQEIVTRKQANVSNVYSTLKDLHVRHAKLDFMETQSYKCVAVSCLNFSSFWEKIFKMFYRLCV
jgi:hypothetical protein